MPNTNEALYAELSRRRAPQFPEEFRQFGELLFAAAEVEAKLPLHERLLRLRLGGVAGTNKIAVTWIRPNAHVVPQPVHRRVTDMGHGLYDTTIVWPDIPESGPRKAQGARMKRYITGLEDRKPFRGGLRLISDNEPVTLEQREAFIANENPFGAIHLNRQTAPVFPIDEDARFAFRATLQTLWDKPVL